MAELDLDWLKAQWRDSLKNWIESGLAEKRWRNIHFEINRIEVSMIPDVFAPADFDVEEELHPVLEESQAKALFHEKMKNRFAGEHSVICKVLMRYCTSENILDWMETARAEVVEESREDANYKALDGNFDFGEFRY